MKSLGRANGTEGFRALATLLLANSLLLAPGWIVAGGIGPSLLALEAVIVVALFWGLPRGRATVPLAGAASVLLVLSSVLAFGDATARMSLARPLNLYLDVRLLSAVLNLLRGSLGPVRATLAVVGAMVVVVGALALLTRLLASLGEKAPDRRRRTVAMVVALVALVAIPARWLHPYGVVLGAPVVRLVREQSVRMVEMIREEGRFSQEMAASPSSYREVPGLLDRLEGRDVVLAFVESYGVSAVEDPRYAPIVRPRLTSMENAAREVGLHMATGSLRAPSQGGMSWLGHGSVLSGLWLENQLRYDLLLATDRETLVDDFQAAGYRTVALMPAITLAWPEGERLGYERVYARDDIAYEGPPLNWVTMPDQFTWSFLETSIREEADERPLFAEIGLISSHAPWTPILPVLDDWDQVGDGRIFERWAGQGMSPEELWRDTERVREHYAMAVGYALDVLASYANRFVDDRTLLIALGDHQPAPMITGEDARRDVPVHVFARDAELLEPFIAWGFRPGAFPAEGAKARRMDAFRDWFVTAFSESGPVSAGLR